MFSVISFISEKHNVSHIFNILKIVTSYRSSKTLMKNYQQIKYLENYYGSSIDKTKTENKPQIINR